MNGDLLLRRGPSDNRKYRKKETIGVIINYGREVDNTSVEASLDVISVKNGSG